MILTLSIRNVDRLEGDLPTSLVLDGQGAVLGRSVNCDWLLPDPMNRISGRHCEIHYRDGAYVLKDTSTNGTYLWRAQDRLPGEHVIAHGEVFEIGHYEVTAALAEPVAERTALWPEGSAPLAGAAPAWPAAPEPPAEPEPAPEAAGDPFPDPVEAPMPEPEGEPPSWPVMGQSAQPVEAELAPAAPDAWQPPAEDPALDSIELTPPADPGPPAQDTGAPESGPWGMIRPSGSADAGPGWETPEQEEAQPAAGDWDVVPAQPSAPEPSSIETSGREPTSWGMSLPGRQPTEVSWGVPPAEPAPLDTGQADAGPGEPSAPPAASRSEGRAWGVSLRGREAPEPPPPPAGLDGPPEAPAEQPLSPPEPESAPPVSWDVTPSAQPAGEQLVDAPPEAGAPAEDMASDPPSAPEATPEQPPMGDSWDDIPVPDLPQPEPEAPPVEIKLRPPTLFQPQPIDPVEAVAPAPAAPPSADPPALDPAAFEGQLREPTSLYIAQAAGEAGELPLFADRYRIDGKPVSGPLFEDARAIDTWLDRAVLVRRVRDDASPTAKGVAAGYFQRWRQFARHRIAGMPPIVGVGDAYVVLDIADTIPLDQLLESDSVRSFRPWILDRVLCEALRALVDIHALGLVHGDVRAGNLLVSMVNGAVYLTNPVPAGVGAAPYTAAADIGALGKAVEDAAWGIGATPRAVIGWMTAPEASRPTAVELLETVGLGMQALKPMFAPADPAPAPADPVQMPGDWAPTAYDAEPNG